MQFLQRGGAIGERFAEVANSSVPDAVFLNPQTSQGVIPCQRCGQAFNPYGTKFVVQQFQPGDRAVVIKRLGQLRGTLRSQFIEGQIQGVQPGQASIQSIC